MTFSPTPPQPKTATVSPGRTFAVLMTAPTPVITPQPTRHARSRGISSGILMAAVARTTVRSANEPTPAMREISMPFLTKTFSSPVIRPCWLRSHRCTVPATQKWHLPQFSTQERTTWSPFFSVVTSFPTSSTTPAPSCPSTTGGGSGSFICCTERSEWHTPLAATLTTTSSARGGFSSSESTVRASLKLYSTAPRTMVRLPVLEWGTRYRTPRKARSSDERLTGRVSAARRARARRDPSRRSPPPPRRCSAGTRAARRRATARARTAS